MRFFRPTPTDRTVGSYEERHGEFRQTRHGPARPGYPSPHNAGAGGPDEPGHEGQGQCDRSRVRSTGIRPPFQFSLHRTWYVVLGRAGCVLLASLILAMAGHAGAQAPADTGRGIRAGGTAPASDAGARPFDPGWTLQSSSSKLNFQSVKSQTIVESSTFASLRGAIAPDGTATVTISLDSVDTGIDLRNVRMRFLFFETFKFPEAVITLRLDPAALQNLQTARRMPLKLKYDLSLHGVTLPMQSDVVVTLLTDTLVSVASGTPISIGAAAFGLADGVKKLEDANQVPIIPSGSVTFDFLFQKNGAAEPARPVTAAATQTTPPVPSPPPVTLPPAATAVETAGELSNEACAGRFEIISRTGAIYFKTGSAELDSESKPLLDSIVQIVRRCPNLRIQVAGHTDSSGVASTNKSLSEARAKAVVNWLVGNGVASARLEAVGFGDTLPVAAEMTPGLEHEPQSPHRVLCGGRRLVHSAQRF